MVAEDDYVQRDRPAERADIVVDGNPTIAHDVETEFVRLPF
jgi:hypothetical protein